jgi:quercetin dioxygenase-like cupin family protein
MLQTGASAELEQVVPADFVDHGVTGDTGREELFRSIQDLRNRFPTMRLAVAELYGSGDRVVALLTITGASGGDFLGIEASGGMATWAPAETLRIEGDQILERGSIAAFDAHAEPFFATRLVPPALSATIADRAPVLSIRLDRLAIQPGAGMSGSAETAWLVYVETGSVETTVDGDSNLIRAGEHGQDGAVVPGGETTLLGPGDTLTVAERTWRRLRATGSTPTSVVIVRLGMVAFPEVISADHPERAFPALDMTNPGVIATTLVDAHPDIAVDEEPVVTEGGRVILAPGTFVSGVGDRPLTIVIVERGALTVERNGERRSFEAGTALIALAGDVPILRNSGVEPLSVLVFSIETNPTIAPAR